MNDDCNHRLKNIVFISSLAHPATSISLLRALLSLNDYKVKIISDVENQEFPQIILKRGFFDVTEVVDYETDLVLFIEGGSFQLFPINIHKINAITAWYGIDTHTNFKKHVAISKLFDITFISQKEYLSKISNLTNKITHWLPLAFDESIIVENGENESVKKYDIAYVGSMDSEVHPVRFRLINKIRETNLKKFIGTCSTSNMYKIYKDSKCVFNYSINNDLNMRVFEAIGNGSILFTNKIIGNGLQELFEEGLDYIIYSEDSFEYDLGELTKKLNLFNSYSNLRIEKVHKFHKYSNRIKSLLDYIKSFNNKQYSKPYDIDIFDYMRIAYLNNSFKIVLKIYFNILNSRNKRQNFLIQLARKIFI